MRTESLLVVDDERDFASGLARILEIEFPGGPVLVAGSGEEALEVLKREAPAVMLTDLRMPGMSGMELLRTVAAERSEMTVVILTAFGDIRSAVEAVKSGAYDFLTKPVERGAVARVVAKGLERARLMGENRRLRDLLGRAGDKAGLVGESPAMVQLRRELTSVAATDYTVLITGESGTGKELVSRSIQRLSPRSSRPFLSVNCPAIPGSLLESELFGHIKGAFTGADRSHKGLFLAADSGTLLLDEIGDMDMSLQIKLLRVLQEREVRPVGSSRSVPVDVRILATTNQRLEARIQAGEFREDLYHRLNVLAVHIPPLRERREDIPLLVSHFLDQTCAELGLCCKDITPEALAWLSVQPWPGNVRELGNFVRRLVVHSGGPVIDREHLSVGESPAAPSQGEPGGVKPYIEAKRQITDEFTRSYVAELMRRTSGNISEAARLSGLERWSLQKILKRLGDPRQE